MIIRHGRDYTSLRIRAETRRKLKLLASMRNKTQIDLVDELVTDELKRMGASAPPQKEQQ